MPQDGLEDEKTASEMREADKEETESLRAESKHTSTTARQKRSWFAVPPPIRYLFDHTPLITYHPNGLPIWSPRTRHQNALYIFTTPEEAASNVPSFNPGCLKWQVGRLNLYCHSQWEDPTNKETPSDSPQDLWHLIHDRTQLKPCLPDRRSPFPPPCLNPLGFTSPTLKPDTNNSAKAARVLTQPRPLEPPQSGSLIRAARSPARPDPTRLPSCAVSSSINF